MYSVSQKIPLLRFSDIFSKQFRIFNQFFYTPITRSFLRSDACVLVTGAEMRSVLQDNDSLMTTCCRRRWKRCVENTSSTSALVRLTSWH